MNLDGSYIALVVGAWLAYRIGCWVHDRAEKREA